MMRGLYILVLSVMTTQAAHRIGGEAALTLPSSAKFILSQGFVPDDGLVATNNPPLFNWVYTPDPYLIGTDETPKVFKFQLTTNASADFTTPYWDITTSNNLYNFLPPITNASGVTYGGTSWWRVVYYPSNGVGAASVSTSAVHHFSISATASNWNRAMLADTNWVQARLTNIHPHMWFNAANSNAVGAWYRAGNSLLGTWSTYETYVSQVITNEWFWNPNVFTNSEPFYGHAQEIATVGLIYNFTTDSALRANILASNAPALVDLFARQWMSSTYHNPMRGNDRVSAYIMNSGLLHLWALSVDFFWNDMSANQRATNQMAMENTILFYMNQDWWFLDERDPALADNTNRVYSYNQRKMHFGSGPKQGDGHSREDIGSGLMFSMLLYSHSQVARDAFPFFLNFLIARHDHARMDEGTYRDQSVFYGGRNLSALQTAWIKFDEVDLKRSPIVLYEAQHLAYFEPILFHSIGDRWGDLPGVSQASTWGYSRMRQAAMLTQNPYVLQQHLRQKTATGFAEESALLDSSSLYYFNTNFTPAPWPSNAYVNLRDGWVIAAGTTPDNEGAFTNAVRFETAARPGIGRVEHAGWGDGSFFLSAYGANVTASGASFYKKHPDYHFGMVEVNGLGIQAPIGDPIHDWYSRITAFTNIGEFIYTASDTVRAYNRSNFIVPTAAYNDASPYYNTNKLPELTSMDHHFLFNTNGYLIVYSKMATTTNATFSWLARILETNAIMTSNGVLYTVTNHTHGSTVSVVVASMINTNLTALVRVNNGTNQDWSTLRVSNAFYNPITFQTLTNPPDIYSQPVVADTIWITNRTRATNWHFLTAIGASKWGIAPFQFARLDDYTVKVTLPDGSLQTNTFDTNYQSAFNVMVDAGATNAAPEGGGGAASIISSIKFGPGIRAGRRQ